MIMGYVAYSKIQCNVIVDVVTIPAWLAVFDFRLILPLSSLFSRFVPKTIALKASVTWSVITWTTGCQSYLPEVRCACSNQWNAEPKCHTHLYTHTHTVLLLPWCLLPSQSLVIRLFQRLSHFFCREDEQQQEKNSNKSKLCPSIMKLGSDAIIGLMDQENFTAYRLSCKNKSETPMGKTSQKKKIQQTGVG